MKIYSLFGKKLGCFTRILSALEEPLKVDASLALYLFRALLAFNVWLLYMLALLYKCMLNICT